MEVEFSVTGSVATIRLNDPERLNAVSPVMCDLISKYCADVADNGDIRAVLLRGTGRGFCSGANVSGAVNRDRSVATGRRSYPHYQNAVRALHHLDKPVVAAVRGPCVGIGWSLAMASDYLIASDTTKFCMIFMNRGLVPDGGAIHFLTRHVGEFRAKEIVLSRRFVLSEEALRLGLCTEAVADAELDARAEAMAAQLAEGPTLSIGIAKQLFHTRFGSLDDFMSMERCAIPLPGQGEDVQEGALAFAEKRAPKFKGR